MYGIENRRDRYTNENGIIIIIIFVHIRLIKYHTWYKLSHLLYMAIEI